MYNLTTIVIGKHVPVIGWSNSRLLEKTPTIPAGHFVNSDFLQKNYLDRLVASTAPHTICVFVIDKLSIDDITKYSDAYNSDSTGNALANLRVALETSASSIVLPSVDSSQLGSYLSSKVNGQVIELIDPSSLKDKSLDATKTNVIIFQLTTSPNTNDRENEIREADKMIEVVMSELNSMSTPYTALLTAQQAPIKKKLTVNSKDSVKVGRHILESNGQDDKFFFANYTEGACQVFFYSESVIVEKADGKDSLPQETWDTTGSNCTSTKSVFLVMSNDNGTNSYKFEMDIQLDKYNFWNVINATFTMDTNGTQLKQAIDMTFVETPKQFSYHCVQSEAKGTGSGDLKVIFNDLQMQSFKIENNQFSYPNDCIGFFSEGIWMGLVTGLIVILILAFGFGMLASLSVMDKFDDPKGKTITVAQSSE
ncbi:V-type proton ATPase subunit S1-like isoform X2 [Antedon mediterranea]|uniref:V-type proton ATPase subunit S1-like isoform X2 n=1 Tax=Antedon mediterranea TaxID=105859 RepID=UPI003AF7AA22